MSILVSDDYRSGCPIASALDVVGDRWSLVIVRSMMLMRLRTYGELLNAPEKISTNILADRLKKLEAAGVIRSHGRAGYELTDKGRDLLPVLQALSAWGESYIDDRWKPLNGFYTCTPADFL